MGVPLVALVVVLMYRGGRGASDAAALVPAPTGAASAIEKPDLPSLRAGLFPPVAPWGGTRGGAGLGGGLDNVLQVWLYSVVTAAIEDGAPVNIGSGLGHPVLWLTSKRLQELGLGRGTGSQRMREIG